MLSKVFLIALFFIGIFSGIGFLIGNLIGYLIGEWVVPLITIAFFLISILMCLIAFFFAPKIILRKYKAKLSDNKNFNEIVERMAIEADIKPTPKAYISPIDVPNSFSTGINEKAAICVTEGLLTFSKGEIEGIVAHGMWHIRDRNVIVQDFASVLAYMLYLTVIFIPLAILILKVSLSPLREYHADYYGSRFSKKPKDLANALNKISEVARRNPLKGSPAFESVWLVDPFKREGLPRWFSTDPPTTRRVKRLHDMVHEGMPEPPEVL